jgi:cation/acetate symporter
MLPPTSETTLVDRSTLDARIVFVSSVFLLAFAFIALLDRVGAPVRFVGAATPWFTIIALATLGFLLHSTRVSTYYAADRSVPGAYAGFANAAIMIALALPFSARLAGHSWMVGVNAGIVIGLAIATLYLGPILRRSDAYSISGLIAARFQDEKARIGLVIAIALASGLLAIAGNLIAVEALSDLTGAGRSVAAFAIGAASLFIAGPGGLSGVIWATAAAGGVALVGFGWPIVSLWFHGELPVGVLGGGAEWSRASDLLANWQIMPKPMIFGVEFSVTLAMALGVAALAPILAPAVTTANFAAARRSGIATMLWSAVFMALVSTAMAAAALTFATITENKPSEQLPTPVYSESSRGLITICNDYAGGPLQAQKACAEQDVKPGAPLKAADIRPVDSGFLIGSLPELKELGAAASGLFASAMVGLGLALCAMGLQACGAAVGHDALYHLRGETDLSSRRLAITRMALIFVSALGYALSVLNIFAPGELVALALAISAACVAPSVILIFWPRAGDREALIALGGGALGMIMALFAAEARRRVDVYALAGLGGATLALAAAAISGLYAPDNPHARSFVKKLFDDRQDAPDADATY